MSKLRTTMLERIILVAGLFVAQGTIVLFAVAQSQPIAKALRPTPEQVKLSRSLDWKTMPWKEDNTPYKRMRLYIDKFIAQGQKPTDLVKKYETLARRDPYEAKAQYRWAYAAYRAATQRGQEYDLKVTFLPWQAMRETLMPQVYDWTRLRFLIEYRQTLSQDLLPVAERLLERDQKDIEVKYEYIEVLSNSSLPNRRKAVIISEQLAKQFPKSLRYKGGLAGTYFTLWELTKAPADHRRAVAAYESYLKVSPANDPFRSSAQRWLRYLKEHGDAQGRYLKSSR